MPHGSTNAAAVAVAGVATTGRSFAELAAAGGEDGGGAAATDAAQAGPSAAVTLRPCRSTCLYRRYLAAIGAWGRGRISGS